ncbi:maleylpyruvate isomerase family mycothiol-dependent enzyme [Phytoactinopolyspora alkaliphila]|uniref:Maleylpyruvate isomerase family mycothiol-dependent enzyme n=1 Tax=Phytoactinopolyspora alkaliphila TaxID=1783498 RepID=A0A6N9YMP4_9ACTN|nr:maleylpyruvate isomerase family mycothiol-dependent enzyme [Phytoactinopolyspora alkaliphila]NED96217.1 maleylpyruvate isomerase family mycothiol-dependent enzyme [Phytoactinopolyspora alkaliphila]
MADRAAVAVTRKLTSVMEDCRAAGSALRRVVGGLDEPTLRASSNLPGWSRAHVLAHITNVGHGAARQVEYAARGELIDFYDGGRPGRNAAIEAGAALPMEDHRHQVHSMLDRLEGTWPPDGSPLWEQRVLYRDGSVADVLLTWWREVRIHLVDLDAGIGADTWNEPFCRHLFVFLAPRLPSGTAVELRFTDPDVGGMSEPWRVHGTASGEVLVVEGGMRDIALWLAGRDPQRLPTARSGARVRELPGLYPWPSPQR